MTIFLKNCEFVAGAAKVDQIPTLDLPEFAFVGRSNVGKSSLINALTNRKSLARVSQTPGCTRQINFFMVDEQLHIVDLPGYGFAKISNKERNSWDYLIHTYLRGRSQLMRVFLLIDSRHELKKIDEKTMDFLDDYGISYQIILTKCDKASHLQKMLDSITEVSKKHAACHPVVICTSSSSKLGIDELRAEIETLASR